MDIDRRRRARLAAHQQHQDQDTATIVRSSSRDLVGEIKDQGVMLPQAVLGASRATYGDPSWRPACRRGGLCIMAAMSAGDCESMSPIRVIPLVFVGTTFAAGADAALRPVGFRALAATLTAGGTCPPSPNRIMPLLCNRPMIGGGATGPIGVRAGLLVVFLLATSVGLFHHRPSRKQKLPVVGRSSVGSPAASRALSGRAVRPRIPAA